MTPFMLNIIYIILLFIQPDIDFTVDIFLINRVLYSFFRILI
jgi:hypothetical protein